MRGKEQQIHDTDTKKHKQHEAFTPRAFQSCSASLQDFPDETLPIPAKAKHVPSYEEVGQGTRGSAEHLVFYFLLSFPPSPQSYMSERLPWKERTDHGTLSDQGSK